MEAFYLKLYTHILKERSTLMLLKQRMLHRKMCNFKSHLPTSHIFFVTSLCFLNYFINICIRAGPYFHESTNIGVYNIT